MCHCSRLPSSWLGCNQTAGPVYRLCVSYVCCCRLASNNVTMQIDSAPLRFLTCFMGATFTCAGRSEDASCVMCPS